MTNRWRYKIKPLKILKELLPEEELIRQPCPNGHVSGGSGLRWLALLCSESAA